MNADLPDLTLQEFAERFQLNPQYVRRLAKEGRLPGGYRFLGGWRIRRNVVESIRNGDLHHTEKLPR